MRKPGSLLVLATALQLGGCIVATDGHGDDAGDDTIIGDDDNDPPPPPPPPPPKPALADSYAVTSVLDLSASTIAPEPVSQAIDALREFQTSPGNAIFDLAEQAGVPAVADIRAALPD